MKTAPPLAPLAPPLALAALLVACGPTSSAASPAPVSSAARGVEGAGGAPPAAAEDPALPEASRAAQAKRPEITLAVPVPADVACSLQTATWAPKSSFTALAIKPGGAAFANGHAGEATLWLPTGKPSSPTLELESGGVVVRGHIPVEDVVLRPAAPFTLGTFLAAKPDARLSWSGGTAGRVEVGLPVPAQVRGKRSVELAERPCSDLSLDERTFEAIKVLFGENLASARLEARTVPIAATATGGTDAIFLNDGGSRWVTVVKKDGKRTRVAFDMGTAIVFGWVDSNLVVTRGGGWRTRGPRVTFGAVKNDSAAAERRFCAEDLPLYAERDGAHDVVGRITEGTTIYVDVRGPEWSKVAVVASQIVPAKGVRFVVQTPRLDACTEALPKGSPKKEPTATQ
ncbi:MAG: hypothetical protein IPG04_09110 [Polyangiaceae bacterium]|nr:hypothetical protein [Polyangiaceae bacterium]